MGSCPQVDARCSRRFVRHYFDYIGGLIVCCMSQKTEKPTLSGQRIKTRKRDEKEKYDPLGFRDIILAGFAEAGDDLDSIWKYLDVSGSKLDYRRYGEVLFDILIAGGVLAQKG